MGRVEALYLEVKTIPRLCNPWKIYFCRSVYDVYNYEDISLVLKLSVRVYVHQSFCFQGPNKPGEIITIPAGSTNVFAKVKGNTENMLGERPAF